MAAKTPENTYVEFKQQGQLRVALILENRGLCWKVRDEKTGEEFQVQKRSVTRQWVEEPEEESAPTTAPSPEFSSMLGQLNGQAAAQGKPAPKAKEKKEQAERDPNLVSLKELCFELKVEPRIARRRLRKAVGQVGTGSRWEWMKDSDALAAVKAVLSNPAPEAEAE